MKPTPDEIQKARQTILTGDTVAYNDDVCIGKEDIDAIRVLLAATEPQDDIPIERRNHFRMTPHRRPNGPVFCVDQRGNGEFDVYFEHQDKFVWSSFQLYQFAQWAQQAWNKT